MTTPAALLFGLALLAAAPAPAQRAASALASHAGQFGFGYFTTDAPIGVRYWTARGLGLEAGIGFQARTEVPLEEEAEETTSLAAVHVEAGVLFPMAVGAQSVLFFRPGVGVSRAQEVIGDPGDRERATGTTFAVSALLGVELFLGELGFPDLSFGGGHGLVMESHTPAAGGPTEVSIGTTIADISVVHSGTIGFRLYF